MADVRCKAAERPRGVFELILPVLVVVGLITLPFVLAGCAATASPPNPDGKHELITDPWERVGQQMGKQK